MPASTDIELQTRRAFWLMRYWSCARENQCDKFGDHGLCREWGFANDGSPLLEKPESLEERQKVLKNIITTCRCKSGCKNGRCSCYKEPNRVLCVMCECKNCENTGSFTAAELNAVSLSVDEFAVGGGNGIDTEVNESDVEQVASDSEDSDGGSYSCLQVGMGEDGEVPDGSNTDYGM